MANVGNLEVIVCDGKLRDVEVFGDQDPFCVLELGGQRHKTKVCQDAGEDPVFNERFTFLKVGPGTGADQLVVRVWDHNTFNDKEIGAAGVSMAKVYAAGCDELRVPLYTHKGKPAGELRMMFIFKPFVGAVSSPPPLAPSAAVYPTAGRPPFYPALGLAPGYPPAAGPSAAMPSPFAPQPSFPAQSSFCAQPSFTAQPSFSSTSFSGSSSGGYPAAPAAAPSSPTSYPPFPGAAAGPATRSAAPMPAPCQPQPFPGLAAGPAARTAAPVPVPCQPLPFPVAGSAAAPYPAAAPAPGPYPGALRTDAPQPLQALPYPCTQQPFSGMGQPGLYARQATFDPPSC